MRRLISLAAVSCFYFSSDSIAAEREFNRGVSEARANGETEEGARYDRALGEAIQSLPEFAPSMSACLDGREGERSVHGYFHFTANANYTVVLEPRSPFSECLAQALEGHEVPAPPKMPYFNSFKFSTED